MNRCTGRIAGLIMLIVVLAVAAIGLPARWHRVPAGPRTIVASIRAEPKSFNRYVARDLTTTVITYLAHGALVRVNRTTDQLEPEVAERWELLGDGRTYRVSLRRGLRFSDGAPLTADDVVFSFRAIYDARTESLLADTVQVGGQPLAFTAEGVDTVLIQFPAAFGPGLRVLDTIPIYPRHRLEAALKAGTFREAWSLATPPSDMAGLGPFRLERYEPGKRVTFSRNPFYVGSDANGPLPRADRVVLEIVPSQDTESLRLQAGDIAFTQSEVRPADYAALERAVENGRVSLTDLGTSLDGDLFWVNLKAAPEPNPRWRWLQHVNFRRAVAQSVDRDGFVSNVYLGAAVPGYTLVSPANRQWFANEPAPAYDIAGAKNALASLGLVDRDGDGVLDDEASGPVELTLLTQSGNTSLERGASTIRDGLARVGVRVNVVPLEVGALVQRIMTGNYDAAYFHLVTTDTDPSLNADFWASAGSAHVWNPAQRRAATPWEERVDALMTQISATPDQPRRRDLFREVQQIVARELPALCFAYPRVWVAMSTRVTGATPAAFRPPILWNPAVVGIGPARP